MKLYLKVIGCSCYTCLSQTVPAAAQTDQKMALDTGTDAPPVAQRLLTNTWPKQVQHNTYKQTKANTKKQYINI